MPECLSITVLHIVYDYVSGVAALTGVTVPGEVYAWVVVFLLPVNSAINPILYTITSIRFKKVSQSYCIL